MVMAGLDTINVQSVNTICEHTMNLHKIKLTTPSRDPAQDKDEKQSKLYN